MASIVLDPRPATATTAVARKTTVVTSRGLPIVLSTGRLALTNAGEVVTFDHERLQPREQKAFVLQEIRFLIRTTMAAAVFAGWATRAKINIGVHALTANFVPLWAMCQNMYAQIVGGVANAEGDGLTWYYKTFRWRLPTPILIPPGTPIGMQAQRQPLAATWADASASLGLDIAISGHFTDLPVSMPARSRYPFVTAFQPSVAQSSWESNELTLGNPLDVPITCQRLIGRVVDTSSVISAATEWVYANDGAIRALTIEMRDQQLNDIVPAGTVWDHVFESQLCSFPLAGMTMQRGDAFFTRINASAATLIPMIGLIAEREE